MGHGDPTWKDPPGGLPRPSDIESWFIRLTAHPQSMKQDRHLPRPRRARVFLALSQCTVKKRTGRGCRPVGGNLLTARRYSASLLLNRSAFQWNFQRAAGSIARDIQSARVSSSGIGSEENADDTAISGFERATAIAMEFEVACVSLVNGD